MNKKYISKFLIGFLVSSILMSGCGNAKATTQNDNKPKTESTQTAQTAQTAQNSQIESYFTRKDGNLDKILIKEINAADKELNIAIYSLTKKDITDAIIDLKKKCKCESNNG